MWALYAREVKRFQKLLLDTVLSPIASMVLYLAVFGVVAGGRSIDGVNYLTFIYVGLLSMIIINSSFSNPGFALVIAKNLGTMVDLQLSPIQPWRIGIAYALAALTRGAFTFVLAMILTFWFIPGFTIQNPLLLFVVIFISGLQYGMLGAIFGMWAKNFEALTFVTTFVLQPMIFLAGIFYPISTLPAPWNTISAFNPLHHNINLFRYAFVGYKDVDPYFSLGVICVLSVLLFVVMHYSTVKNIKNE